MENSNIPDVPKRNKYPFKDMEIGDYVKIKFDSDGDAMKARIAAVSYASVHKIKFTTRRIGNTLEVWRTAAVDPFFGE